MRTPVIAQEAQHQEPNGNRGRRPTAAPRTATGSPGQPRLPEDDL